ncbi:MAG: hypothetical protein ABIW34_14670 [Ginsengibacter sp.]
MKINYPNNSLNIPPNDNATISYKIPNLKMFSIGSREAVQNLITFELLYDKYAPRAFGFITGYTDTKEQAEKFMTDVFLNVWADIKTFEKDPEKKIQHILLMVCKPIFKKNQI